MPQAIAETVFDVFYLGFAIITGLTMLIKGKSPLVRKAGFMAALLGGGDSFHLVPRVYALWTTGLEDNAAALGIGKFITSITMTIFYLILYYIWRERYQIKDRRGLTVTMWGLSVIRIGLCLLPQNQWLVYRQPLLYGVLRNIPFAAMGIIIAYIIGQQSTFKTMIADLHLYLSFFRKSGNQMTGYFVLCPSRWLCPLDSIFLSFFSAVLSRSSAC